MDGFFYSSFKPSVVSGQDEAKIMERLFCVSKVNLAQKSKDICVPHMHEPYRCGTI